MYTKIEILPGMTKK